MLTREEFKINKNALVFILFLSFMATLALISEFFQTPNFEHLNANLYKNPLGHEFLRKVTKLNFKNRLVEIRAEKKLDPNQIENWYLTAPRKLLAKENPFYLMKGLLSKIKIRKVIPKDSINLSNFSLSPPSVSIELMTSDLERVTFSLGIMNPIDQSAYITYDNQDYIYQIDIPEISLHSFSLNDFIESNIFNVMPQKVTYIKLYQLSKGRYKTTKVDIKQKNGKWYDGAKELDKDKVENFLESLMLTKAQMILDIIPENLTKTIDRYFNPPLYLLELADEDGQKITAEISQLITRTIDELKINKRENVFSKTSHREHPYVIDRKILNILQINHYDFKKR